MTALRIRGLAKSYGGTPAVRSVDLDVAHGKIYALLGPSGCGKTTVLRSVAGLELPDAGRIELDGTDLTAVPVYERPIGMVFQSYAIWPHLTVFENVAYPLRVARVPSAELRTRTTEALARVGMDGYAARQATDLSGGQQQRVALARALVRAPGLLLLDEPLSNLDAKLRRDMRRDLRALIKHLAITTLYVTHDQIEAYALADRIGVMDAGVIIQEGAPRAIYDRPATPFLATFLGSANLLAATIEQGRVRIGSSHATIALAAAGDHPDQAKVTVMVRPEDVVIDAGELPARLESIAFEGSHSIATFDCGGEHLRARVDRAFDRPIGSESMIALDSKRCMVYDSPQRGAIDFAIRGCHG